ncbi:MAG: undecaprenyl-diphosphate phosphatase, partial [Herpetosiphonaceae bacterium]|nr:undecaprenyl-diphosphate phosphatase [Herpetosiphonaceae bacterium]
SGYFNDKYLLIAVLLGSMGMVFYVVDRRVPERYDLSDLRWPAALGIGLAQAGALLPGVSRAGATMTMGRVLGLERATAAHFSFLMATPITFGAGLLKLRHLQRTAITPAFWLGIGLAFAVGMLAINVLLRFLQQRGHSFLPFVLYRLALAAVIVLKRVAERGSTTH